MRIVLFCPICRRHELINLPESIVKERKFNFDTLVPLFCKQYICNHSFIAYVDKNWKVRRFMPVEENNPFPHMFALERKRFQEHLIILEQAAVQIPTIKS